ncbi:MAG: alpha-hydroxy-acid oxidizing protein [Oscillospiraceae bacterium]|jgi:glutamate synthase domain-containing protein 2|nr:alpha-hydroxy-acid oxidizing protein [Oscillospiraceae bacterium]
MRYYAPEFMVYRDEERCIACGACARQCSNKVHIIDEEKGKLRAEEENCVNCQRCVALCPTNALHIRHNPNELRLNYNWTQKAVKEVEKQALSGGVLLSAMGNPANHPSYFDRILLNASQVTNPSIDPLREPMETRVYLGRKPSKLEFNADGTLKEKLPPQVELDIPIMISAMSFGSISLNAQKSLARAAEECNTLFNTGEGGMHRDLIGYKNRAVIQVASGRFGVNKEYLNNGRIIEIKIGQGAKPGIGGHVPGEKVNEDVSQARTIPKGTDAISPAPHHDIYSIEDLRQLIYSLKEATDYKKPVSVKIAAVHNVAAIASGCVRAGADILVIDGYKGGTGAAPTRLLENVGIPIELALASVDQRLRDESIRHQVSIVCTGSIHNSADVVKAIALGADAVYIASAVLIAMGCHMCRTCHTGLCNWGIATQREDLTRRLNPDIYAERVANLLKAWNHEIQEMLGGMGINAIESLKGNRLMLRGIGLSETELRILGIKHAGE